MSIQTSSVNLISSGLSSLGNMIGNILASTPPTGYLKIFTSFVFTVFAEGLLVIPRCRILELRNFEIENKTCEVNNRVKGLSFYKDILL